VDREQWGGAGLKCWCRKESEELVEKVEQKTVLHDLFDYCVER